MPADEGDQRRVIARARRRVGREPGWRHNKHRNRHRRNRSALYTRIL